MQWIESGGGPLILVPKEYLSDWRGVDLRPNEDSSDYDRACDVTDEIATIRIGKYEGIVFGDEPFRTTWLVDDAGGLVVRWVYADSESAVAEFLRTANMNDALGETEVLFTTPGECLLFDSAEPGSDIRGDRLEVVLKPGTYALRSALLDPSAEMRLLVHRFMLAS